MRSLLKLIAALSIGGYGFDYRDKRSKQTSQIKDDLLRIGLELDDKTILKWLREAGRLVGDQILDDFFKRNP